MLSQDFREFIQLLNDYEVHYLVIGGYAVALHGHPRYTKDLDIWVEMEPSNARRLTEALTAFGFGSVGLNPEDFLTPDQVIQLGYPPNRIDLITTPDGVDFVTCYPSKIEVKIDDLKIDFIATAKAVRTGTFLVGGVAPPQKCPQQTGNSYIDLENLKINKKASGRLQDLADLEKLSE